MSSVCSRKRKRGSEGPKVCNHCNKGFVWRKNYLQHLNHCNPSQMQETIICTIQNTTIYYNILQYTTIYYTILHILHIQQFTTILYNTSLDYPAPPNFFL